MRLSPTYRPHATGVDRDLQLKDGASATREQTYYHWLANLLQEKAGAQAPVHAMVMTHYRSRRVRRSLASPVMTLPDATIRGACTIEDPAKWHNALAFGIGRHKAYGYGMILLGTV